MADEQELEGVDELDETQHGHEGQEPNEPLPDGEPSSAGGAPEAAPEAASIRDVLGELGYEYEGGFDSDEAAIKHLVEQAQRARQFEPYAPHLNDYLQNLSDYEQFRQSRYQQQPQAQPQAQQPDQPQPLWQTPEYNPNWLTQVERDPQTGELRPLPGANPVVAQKLRDYTEWRHEAIQKILHDPHAAIVQPWWERTQKELMDQVGKLVDQRLGHTQVETEAQQFIQQNSDWLFQSRDGQPVIDPVTGQRTLSAEGARFAELISEAQEYGIADTRKQKDYAMRIIQAERSAAQSAPAKAQASDAQRKQELLKKKAGFSPDASGSVPSPDDPNAPPQNPNTDLADMLRGAFAEAGVTDTDLAEF